MYYYKITYILFFFASWIYNKVQYLKKNKKSKKTIKKLINKKKTTKNLRAQNKEHSKKFFFKSS